MKHYQRDMNKKMRKFDSIVIASTRCTRLISKVNIIHSKRLYWYDMNGLMPISGKWILYCVRSKGNSYWYLAISSQLINFSMLFFFLFFHCLIRFWFIACRMKLLVSLEFAFIIHTEQTRPVRREYCCRNWERERVIIW